MANLFTVTDDGWNKDIPMGMDRHDAREYYLDLWGSFKSKIEKPFDKVKLDAVFTRIENIFLSESLKEGNPGPPTFWDIY